jgi:ABC-type transporter Mla subunit MlaD
MKYKYKRIGAGAMAAVMLCTGIHIPAYGKEASVAVDEAMYVNLDYYGRMETVNVVKSCSLNGQKTFTDYGNYLDVTNMTDYTEPQMEKGSVTWNFPEPEANRFYYKCRLDAEQVELPWNFDISYKLNGVPMNGDQLAGASGLVEIHIDARANDRALEYYRNNMMLAAGVMVDLNDCYSLDAEGAQIQNMGSQTAAVFTALPGEDGDYTIRIGSDSFEMGGVFMAMVPGTAESLEHVVDLKDAKDTWKESGDQFYDSMEQMALSVEAMRDSVQELQQGLSSAEEARKVWSGSKDSILAGNDQVLESLTQVSRQMEVMIPHIETAKEAADVVHDSMEDIVNSMREMQDPLQKLNHALKGIQSGAEDLSGNVPGLNALMQQLIALDAALQASEQAYITELGQLAGSLEQIGKDYQMPETDAEDVELENDLPQTATPSNAAVRTGLGISSHEAPRVGVGVTMDTSELIETLMQKKAALEKLSAASSKLASQMKELLEDGADASRYMAELTECMDFLIEDGTALYDSLDMYYPDLQAALDDTEELVNRTTEALNNGINTAAVLQQTLKDSSDHMDAAARDSISGAMDMLDKSLSVLDSTTAMRQAGRTMKDTLDREWEDLEEDTRFLNMDPNAEKVSFTSEKNQEPESLQIVLRTEEISLDDDDELMDAEAAAGQNTESPLRRMWNVLVKMCKAIAEIFKNR